MCSGVMAAAHHVGGGECSPLLACIPWHDHVACCKTHAEHHTNRPGFTIAFSVVLGVIVGAFFLLESWRYARLPPPGNYTRAPEGVPDDAAGRYIGELPDEASEAATASTQQFMSTATKRGSHEHGGYDLPMANGTNGHASNGHA